MISKNIAKLNNKKKKIIFLMLLLICIIMITVMKTYCDENVPTAVSIRYDNKTLSFYSDFIKFHVKANGYEKIKSEEMENNFFKYSDGGPGREAETENAKMKGYGQYVFKMETTLLDFVRYCYSLNPGMTMACSYREQTDSSVGWDYTKLSTYPEKVLTNEIQKLVDYFWKNMARELGEPFNRYQDLYFYDRFTNKGVIQVFDNLRKLEENGKEFLTCMMSYMFSTNQNSAPNCKIRKGDVVPFLYVKEHTKIRSIKNSPKEIARYAYVACINGWGENIGNDLWLEEYETMFGIYDEDALCEPFENEDEWVDMETLEQWYLETEEKYRDEKGDKGNPLLGSTIIEIIQSDYNIRQQVEATDYFLTNIEGIGDYKENMARNELMAKYMMENEHIQDIIKDYDVGITFITENLQRGTSESKNTKTAVLSDFQVLEFEHTLNVDGHSDDDGISDLTELTDHKKWVDITGPATKTYYDALHSGKTTKSIDAVFTDYAEKSPGIVKYENNKLYYNTYDYNSNPMLNDTDFDGIDDNKELNIANQTSGNFKGTSGEIRKADWTNDFRYFFIDEDKYNDELAAMSLMIANGKEIRTDQTSASNIEQYLRNIGFDNIVLKNHFKINEGAYINGKMYLGKKTIQVGANRKSDKKYKDVYGVFLVDFDDEINAKYLLTNFNADEIEILYESIARDIDDYVDDYISMYPSSNDSCFWLTGYSIAGGIASFIAPYLVGKKETYAYTFGAPAVTNDGPSSNSNIKNIINEDDLIPKVLSAKEGYARNGDKYNSSIYCNLRREYNDLVGNIKGYEGNPHRTNTIRDKISDIRKRETTNELKSRANGLLAKFLINNEYIHDEVTMSAYPEMGTYLNPNIPKVRDAHNIKSYYVLSKSLNGYDLNNTDERWNKKEDEVGSEEVKGDTHDMEIVEAIEKLGVWYVNHVITYRNSKKEDRGTSKAKKYYDDNEGVGHYPVDSAGNRLSDKDSETVIKDLGGKIGYFYEPFSKYATSDDEVYKNDGTNRNYLKRYLGGDCSGFTQGVVYTLSNGERGQEGEDPNILSDTTGLWNHNVSSDKLVYGSYNTDESMLRLGWDKYYLDGKVWKIKSMIDDEIRINTLKEAIGYEMSELGVDFLEPGDLLCSTGHAEFYIGYEYDVIYNNMVTTDINARKLSGIKSIEIKGKARQGYSTFGWGNVQNEFPKQQYNFIYESDGTFRWKQVSSTTEDKYNVIWRKN